LLIELEKDTLKNYEFFSFTSSKSLEGLTVSGGYSQASLGNVKEYFDSFSSDSLNIMEDLGPSELFHSVL